MFCPKCGTENPDEGKFCRKCRADLAAVSRAIGSDTHTGLDLMDVENLAAFDVDGGEGSAYSVSGHGRKRRSNDPDDLIAAGVKSAVTGVGFLIISLVLFLTNVAGGQSWWWAMLIPGFTMLASGLGNMAKAKRVERRLYAGVTRPAKSVGSAKQQAIGQGKTDFISAEGPSVFETGDLVPPSVVENTTRHLKMDPEGETMTLPEIEEKEK